MFTPPQLKRPTMNKISSKRYLQLIKVWKYVQQCVRWFFIRRSCNWRRNAKGTPEPPENNRYRCKNEGRCTIQFSFALGEMQYDMPLHLHMPWSLCLPWKIVVPFKIWLVPQHAGSVLSPRERHILDITKVSSTRIQNDCQYYQRLSPKMWSNYLNI